MVFRLPPYKSNLETLSALGDLNATAIKLRLRKCTDSPDGVQCTVSPVLATTRQSAAPDTR